MSRADKILEKANESMRDEIYEFSNVSGGLTFSIFALPGEDMDVNISHFSGGKGTSNYMKNTSQWPIEGEFAVDGKKMKSIAQDISKKVEKKLVTAAKKYDAEILKILKSAGIFPNK